MSYELQPGQRLDSGSNQYIIRSVLGSGGFGITYSASFSTTIGSLPVQVIVAIKEHFLKNDCARDDSLAITYSKPASDRVENSLRTFISEARRLQSISGGHPNIVHVSEVFSANNTAYYVMEYIEGRSLAELVRETGPLSWQKTYELMKPIVGAVAYLHNNKITHLDIKPANIMLASENDSVRPVLIDFGLSKHYNEDGTATSALNIQGYSDGFAPIEQYAGISTFSPMSDVYSLAATIIFCLTGKTPPSALQLDRETADKLIPGDVPPNVRHILLDALKMHPNERINNAGALISALSNAWEAPMGPMPPIPQSNKSDEKPGEKAADKAENDATRIVGASGGGNSVTPPPVATDDATRLSDNGGKAPADDDQATAMLGAGEEAPAQTFDDKEEHEPKKKSKKLGLILLIVLLAGAVGAGALMYLDNQRSHSDKEDAPDKESSTELDGSYRLGDPAEVAAPEVADPSDSVVADSETDYYISRCYNAIETINGTSTEGELSEALDSAVSAFIQASDYMISNANPTLDSAVASLFTAIANNSNCMYGSSEQRMENQINYLQENFSYVLERLQNNMYSPD